MRSRTKPHRIIREPTRGADTPVCRVPTHRDAALLFTTRRNREHDKFHALQEFGVSRPRTNGEEVSPK